MLIPLSTLIEKYNITPTGVLHVGACRAEEMHAYVSCGIRRSIWIDANPEIMDEMKQHLATFEDHGWTAINACISDKDGERVNFKITNNSGQSSSFLDLAHHKIAHPDVTVERTIELSTTTLDTLCYQYKFMADKYDFLNIDLQGAELHALRGMKANLHKIKYAYIEVNRLELYKGCPMVEDIDRFMLRYGFIRIETCWAGDTGWGDAFYIKTAIQPENINPNPTTMLYFCTYSDKNYLLKGLALNQSLSETVECDYELHYLCLDDETYEHLRRINHASIKPFRISHLASRDHNISKAEKLPPNAYGNEYASFCWALSAIWINFCLKNFVPKGEQITYADSDIYFYQPLFRAPFQTSLAIHQHRFSSYDYKINPVGEFNVGVMIFANDPMGNYLCETWKNWILNPHHPEYALFGTCGDQKWLDKLYMEHAISIDVFDRDGDIGHLAPWNISESRDLNFDKKYFTYRDRRQRLVFYHFSHFNAHFANDNWSSSHHGEWHPENEHTEIRKIYEQYYRTLKQLKTQHQL